MNENEIAVRKRHISTSSGFPRRGRGIVGSCVPANEMKAAYPFG